MEYIPTATQLPGRPVPAHVAIIMDGNGRWAQARGLPRTRGHRKGVEALRHAVRNAGELGVRWLTVYAFSSENWNRPPAEVRDLLGLLKMFIRRDLAELHREGVRVRIIGCRETLPRDIKPLLEEAESLTRANTAMDLIVAFNYGARDEMVRAVKRIADRVADGSLSSDDINQELVSAALDTSSVPDPDLIIRTSGEQRLSNFLLWQAAYSEFVFCDCAWPDFDRDALLHAIAEYQRRDRRYGALAEFPSEATG
ncbi:MAG: isoprenyl transferase [Pseudomonadota bacterium]